MDNVTKIKDWINEHAPMLNGLYRNKYIGMLYDRFGSLPPKSQKSAIYGTIFGIAGIVGVYLLVSYYSLWTASRQATEYRSMANILLQYQKHRRDKSQQIKGLSKNMQLSGGGALKQYLTDVGRTASIAPRTITVEEKGEVTGREDGVKPGSDVKIKQAYVVLQRVNLTQLTSYIKNIEFGQYTLGVSSLKIQNDDKIRGLMRAELTIMAYIFEVEEG